MGHAGSLGRLETEEAKTVTKEERLLEFKKAAFVGVGR
jgi:hypothetical protein